MGSDWTLAQFRLAELQAEAEADLRAQGIYALQTMSRVFLRYEGSHQPLEVSFSDERNLINAFEAIHKQRFGFI